MTKSYRVLFLEVDEDTFPEGSPLVLLDGSVIVREHVIIPSIGHFNHLINRVRGEGTSHATM